MPTKKLFTIDQIQNVCVEWHFFPMHRDKQNYDKNLMTFNLVKSFSYFCDLKKQQKNENDE